MAAISIELGTLRQRRGLAPLDISRELARVQDHVVELSNDLRRVSRELHPASLDQLGLVAAIKAFCARLTEVEDMDVRFASRGITDGVPSDVALCIFRLTQEVLRNAARHSRAKQVRVSVERVDGGLELRVADDGRGFDVAAARRNGSLGLVSMKERVRPLRGRPTGGDLESRRWHRDLRPGAGRMAG